MPYTSEFTGAEIDALLTEIDELEEVGTWTPAFTSSGASFNYGIQDGIYVKIGNLVTCYGFITLTGATTGTLTNALTITGFPFTNGGVHAAPNIGYQSQIDYNALTLGITGIHSAGGVSTALYFTRDDNTAVPLTAAAVDKSGVNLGFSVTFKV